MEQKHTYQTSLWLIVSAAAGAFLGLVLKEKSIVLKPFGDIFLNLLFTAAVPLVFFSIASAAASLSEPKQLGRILSVMLIIFILTGIISSLFMLTGISLLQPQISLHLEKPLAPPENIYFLQKLVQALTVSDFGELFSRKNILPLILFSLLLGIAASALGSKAKPFTDFLAAGNAVMMKLIALIMLYAPIGLGAYFAYLTGILGPQLFELYSQIGLLYYGTATFYFLAAFSIYAWLAGRQSGFQFFWTHIPAPALTALGTGSSVATIPVSLQAAEKIGIPKDIREIVIPIGATIHMDGSCLSAILKIFLLFQLFGMNFFDPSVMAASIGVALLSGIVMSGIPGGGFLGELMIISLYGFPPEALPVISMVGLLVDPPATMVNAAGDNVAGMLAARFLRGKNWMEKET